MPEEKPFERAGRIIRDEIRTKATPQQVWDAWTDPNKITQWFVDKASGAPEVGKTFTWEFEKFGVKIPYEVAAADPAKYFVLRWTPPPGYPPGLLEIFIEREGGETILRLVNSGFREGAEWDAEYQGTVSGWRLTLAILKYYLENYFGRPKTTILQMRPATYSVDAILPWFREPSLLVKWLTSSGGISNPGEQCELALRDGGRVTGRVLAVSKSEAVTSWEDFGGTLELKAFPMGPQKMVGLRGTSWDITPALIAGVEKQMGAAIDRLVGALGTAAASAK